MLLSTPTTTTTLGTATTNSRTTATLDVPGATLHYQVRGAGPVLLMICGGIYDADLLADLAERLADQFAHRLLSAVLLSAVAGTDPAFVFGNSSGGQIALQLAARHPEAAPSMAVFGAAMGTSDESDGDSAAGQCC